VRPARTGYSAPMGTGPVVIGYDGSAAADHALEEAAALLAPREAVVVTVWESGYASTLALSAPGAMMPVAAVDVRAAAALDEGFYENARRVADRGTARARELGLRAEAMVLVDQLSVADTLVRVAEDRDSPLLVVGSSEHSTLGDLVLGSTSKRVLKQAPCAVLVGRAPKGDRQRGGS
jgi:nucleotide-binding universal stress UspA family protein